jgi:tRNA-dihydrouridine synthase
MIGRAAPANPWIFRQIAQYTATGSYERPTVEDRYRMIRAYFQMLLDEAEATKDLPRDARMGETAGKMKQFATWFTHGVPGRSEAARGHLPGADRGRGAGQVIRRRGESSFRGWEAREAE